MPADLQEREGARFRICTSVDWHTPLDSQRLREEARAADDGGVHSIWVTEAWGYDAFSSMTLLSEWTKRVQIGSGIINVYSRSPSALAQHFATLDVLSEGRMIVGIGTSGRKVVEQFHGLPFDRPLRRLREYVEIIDTLLSGRTLEHHGDIFELDGGFRLGCDLVRDRVPIYMATLSPTSVRQTAEIADGWLPVWVPLSNLAGVIGQFRGAAVDRGRDGDLLRIRSPGSIVFTRDVERACSVARSELAFYIARMGDVYYQNLRRLGHSGVADAIREAWNSGGADAAAAAVPWHLADEMTLVTDSVERARERLALQQEAGVDIHSVDVQVESAKERQKIYEALAA